MSDMEKYKMVLLAVACLFMAGLNLWNEFKDWFDKRYQRKEKADNPDESNWKSVPDVIGKSKTVFHSQKEPEQSRQEENIPIHSMDLEKEENPIAYYDGPVSSEEEIILYNGNDAIYSQGQSVTVDEFGILANTLQGKPVPKHEETQVREALQKVQGTDLFEQLVSQVKGAKGIADKIMDGAGNNNEASNTGFDFNKYIRK